MQACAIDNPAELTIVMPTDDHSSIKHPIPKTVKNK